MSAPSMPLHSFPRRIGSNARRWNEWPVLLSLLAVLAGVASLAWLTSPTSPGDGSPEAGFARDMSDHHAQAVEMAEIVRLRTMDPEVRILATDIVLTQQAQIGQMQGWLAVWQLPSQGLEPSMSWMGQPTMDIMPGMATPEEIRFLAQMPSPDMDIQFLRLMLPHHQAAVAMSQAVLERTERPEVVRLATAIVSSQQAEIGAMRELLELRGQASAPAEPSVAAGHHAGAHNEGFASSVANTVRNTARLAPLTLAMFALVWLVLDAGRRELLVSIASDRKALTWQLVATVALILVAAMHLGLAPDHYAESFGFGLFFSIAAVLAAIAGAWILAWPTRGASLFGAGLCLALISLYWLFRIVAPPGTESPETVDLVGLTSKAAETIACLSCMVLYFRFQRKSLTSKGLPV